MSNEIKVNPLVPDEYQFYSGQYPFPLNNILSDGGLFDKIFVSGDPSLAIADEENFYMICCTPQQMLKIMSSLEVGAPIAFPDSYSDVQQIVQQAYEFPNSFGGGDCVDICAEVTNCIDTNEGTQNAIFDYMVERGALGDGNPAGVLDEINNQIILDGSLCDEDNIFAMALQITQLVNQVVTDVFEKMEAGGFLGEQIGNLVEVIPLFKKVGAGELFDLVDNFFFQAFESYAANYDTTVENQLACDLFCIILDNDCVLNWEEIATYYGNKALETYANLTLEQLVVYLATGDFGGIGWVYATYWMFWGVLSLAGKIFGYDALLITRILQSTTNDSNSDWMFLCDMCGDSFSYQILFGTTQGHTSEYTVVIGNSSFTNLVGTTLNGGTQKLQVTIDVPTPKELTHIALSVGRDVSATGGTRQVQLLNGGFIQETWNFGNTLGVTLYEHDVVSPALIDQIKIICDTGTSVGSIWATQITIDGDGVSPW